MTEIFVFGSNQAGRHGAGSALEARLRHGAIYGLGEGRQGNSYAIPTKNKRLRVLPLSLIKAAVFRFLAYALEHEDDLFTIVAIGCGLAGYTPDEIGPMFREAPDNCKLPPQFEKYRREAR